ncbi:Methyltransferase, NNMT/PNMT/TEMT family and Putative NNMT/PNMT/TEMT methyltransferase, nematoda family-containing protein [Strongyloides ratti]|uniref:Methyltransferase, NNMT/PNMT/TEMT family and Putative NNMT/PNMT/TEMT methyltransferase, nematoda family-containing protein n=1 Tax=Strongyloides ratti TaxID=34506 RepID=A0A090LAP9_STRRB|nr:Methyltransferase, NNMT/PNMT/TEMT family and Putative NNMT/PNMT/TEMT methyltransferase, nematoda family-containing protein [Strongyloides ratti]CEF64610.1 Methyltransferase, NNMT/PNMT/TEMT family and Putative NNMT/PNMT/TEMT methyltransferase, nematoda family-containing protein [Strongyloides ratti]
MAFTKILNSKSGTKDVVNEENDEDVIIFTANDYKTEFDAKAYLNFYYSKEAMETGTRLSLFALPMFAHIIKNSIPDSNKKCTLIDIGAGPTVYSALCFREVVEKIYLTDYVDQSLNILKSWQNRTLDFDWKYVIKIIKRTEGGLPLVGKQFEDFEEKARECVKKGGIFKSDVHSDEICDWDECGIEEKEFDILVSVFCLESACSNYDEYKKSLKRLSNIIKPGGKLILGSVVEDDTYNSGVNSKSGKSTIFTLLHLTEKFIKECLEEVGMNMNTYKEYLLGNEGVLFLMVSKKI